MFYGAYVINGVPLNFVDFDQSYISIDTLQPRILIRLNYLSLDDWIVKRPILRVQTN